MEAWTPLLLVIQCFSCLFMTGLIWVVQWIHYPGFAYVAEKEFAGFHGFHSRRITGIVAPVMGLELVSAFFLCFLSDNLFIWNLLSVLLLWAITWFESIPLHEALAKRFTEPTFRRLLLANWARTALWSLRSLAMGVLVLARLHSG